MITGLIGMPIAITFLSLCLGNITAIEQPRLGLLFALGGLVVVSIIIICITVLALNGVR